MATGLRSIVAGILLAVMLVGPASAAPPEQGHEQFDFGFVFAECNGFDILGDGTFSSHWIVFDTRTDPDRIIEHQALDYVMTRSDTGAIVGTGWGRSTLHAPLDGLETSTFTGARLFETFADGTRIVAIGQIAFDGDGNVVHSGGPHPFETTEVDRCEHVAA